MSKENCYGCKHYCDSRGGYCRIGEDVLSRCHYEPYEVKEYPPYLDHPKPRKTVTNGDKIRHMTDEGLAEFFFKDPFHAYMKTPEENLLWLKQEAET